MKGTPLYLGIDPGLSGGIAALTADGAVAWTSKMFDNERGLLDALLGLSSSTLDETGQPHIRASLERVHSSPQMGVTSAFTFGKGYGGLRMALLAADVSFEEVTPQSWQKSLGCLSRGDKNVTKRKAQDLFPRVTVTHAISDALLLAEFCRRLHVGTVHAKTA